MTHTNGYELIYGPVWFFDLWAWSLRWFLACIKCSQRFTTNLLDENKSDRGFEKGKIVRKTHPSFRPCNFSRELFIKIYTTIEYLCVYFPLTFHDTLIQFMLFGMQLDFHTRLNQTLNFLCHYLLNGKMLLAKERLCFLLRYLSMKWSQVECIIAE